jgi:hypothetical protein
MRSGEAIFALLFAGFLLLTGCRQIVGIEPREVSDAGAPAATFPACGLQIRGSACAACTAMHCCAAAQQCVGECLLTQTCAETCASGDSACRLGCSNHWDPVNDQQTQLQDCLETSCVDACGPWDCLGRVAWQIPDPVPATITITATAMWGADVNAGVHVRVCSIADPRCVAELTSGDTDQNGSVQLTVSTQGNPASVYLELHKDGWLDDLLLLDTPPLSYNFDVGAVAMDTLADVATIAANTAPPATYDPTLAVVKLRVSNCNLQSSPGIDLTWADPGAATIAPGEMNEWVALNLPVPANGTTRVVARRADPTASQDAGTAAFIASVSLIVRPGAITLAPFVAPTP